MNNTTSPFTQQELNEALLHGLDTVAAREGVIYARWDRIEIDMRRNNVVFFRELDVVGTLNFDGPKGADVLTLTGLLGLIRIEAK